MGMCCACMAPDASLFNCQNKYPTCSQVLLSPHVSPASPRPSTGAPPAAAASPPPLACSHTSRQPTSRTASESLHWRRCGGLSWGLQTAWGWAGWAGDPAAGVEWLADGLCIFVASVNAISLAVNPSPPGGRLRALPRSAPTPQHPAHNCTPCTHPSPPPTPQALPLRPRVRGLHPAEQTRPRGALQGHPRAAGGSCHRRRAVPHVSAAGSMRCAAQQGDVCCCSALAGDVCGGGGSVNDGTEGHNSSAEHSGAVTAGFTLCRSGRLWRRARQLRRRAPHVTASCCTLCHVRPMSSLFAAAGP